MVPYRPQSADCSEAMDRAMFDRIHAMSPSERLSAVSAACLAADRLQMAGLRLQYPDADDASLRRRAGVRRVGKEFLRRFYGDAVEGWPD